MRSERGFALVITLLITALLIALTAEFVNEVFVDTSARQNFTDAQQASLLAGSGITGGIKLLQFRLGNQTYSSQADLDQFAKLMHIEDENGTIQVTAEEESGKLNINAIVDSFGKDDFIYRPIAERLFKKLGLKPEILDAVADWIGTNQVARTAGAKTPYYANLKPPYTAKSARLDTFEELRLVKGFDKKTLELLRPYITVYYDDFTRTTALININTASKEVIAALADDATADAIVDYRKAHPLQNFGDLTKVPGISSGSNNLTISNTSFKGVTYRILSQAKVNETVRIVEAVVQLGATQQQILYWREY